MQIARPSAACLEATEINWFPSSGHTEPLYDSSTSEQIVTADALAACYHTVEIDQSTSASSVHAAVDETFSAQDCEWIPCDAIIVPSADASTLNMQEQPMQSEDGSVVIGEPNSKKETKKKVRKRVRNDKIWKKNARKTVYNSGQSKRYKGEEQERTVKTCGGVEGNVWKSLAKMTSKLYIENSGLWVTRKGGQTSLSTIPSASQSNAALVVARSSTLTIIFCQRVTTEL